MKRCIFITGTDTGVGKTVVTAGLVRLARTEGIAAAAVKPVETGCVTRGTELYPEDGTLLREASERALSLDECAPWRFSLPASPARASAAQGTELDIEQMSHHIRSVATRLELVMVEGAGGLMVPIQGRTMMIDLIERLGCPALLVARTRLGTVNHTLLSVESLRNRGIELLGVVLSHSSPEIGPEEQFTPADLASLVKPVPVAVLQYLDEPSRSDPAEIALAMRREWDETLWRNWLTTNSFRPGRASA